MTRKTDKAIERIPYTLAQSYRDMCAGAPPWVALNEFLHEWFDYAQDLRYTLIVESIIPMSNAFEEGQTELWRWAIFCVAIVEYLCERDQIERPVWADRMLNTLATPWYGFGAPGTAKTAVRDHLERTTPEPFRQRNIFCGDRVFANKYTFAQSAASQRATGG